MKCIANEPYFNQTSFDIDSPFCGSVVMFFFKVWLESHHVSTCGVSKHKLTCRGSDLPWSCWLLHANSRSHFNTTLQLVREAIETLTCEHISSLLQVVKQK